ncbi:CCNE [Acanthosepion pharaonis]|uniref:CCNE n=1 Tax=Acanthosepion pharaonis TaxID=158019 RepID=A0A812DKD2_ACAPH|nr:CCNE [Sepia pharaonis]
MFIVTNPHPPCSICNPLYSIVTNPHPPYSIVTNLIPPYSILYKHSRSRGSTMPCRRSKTKSAMSNASTSDNRKRKSQDSFTQNCVRVPKKKNSFCLSLFFSCPPHFPAVCKLEMRVSLFSLSLSLSLTGDSCWVLLENQFISIAGDSLIESSSIIPTLEELHTAGTSTRSTPSELFGGSQFRFQNHFITPTRHSPLPKLNWADSKEVWRVMIEKELHYAKDPSMLERHPSLQAKMRTILLDWLIEVCEVYKLHRETYYLAHDFIDRYLTKERDIIKHQLQLIGITALFIAAKLEEIYPPKLADFAYVTDGACSESEILDQELIMLQLVDICMLDISSLNYSNSVIAASALYHKSSSNVVLSVSGLTMADLLPCIRWMEPYALTVQEAGPVELKFFPTVHIDDSHNIQTHAVDLELLEKAHTRRELEAAKCDNIQTGAEMNLLTPPLSDKKGNSCDNLMCSSSTPKSKHSETTSNSSP